MSFLDELTELSQEMSLKELIGKAAAKWAHEGSDAVLNNMDEHPAYLKNMMYIINFNNLFMCLGLKGFILRSSKKTYAKTTAAFNYIGFLPVIKVLMDIADKPELGLYYNDRNYKLSADFEQMLASLEVRLKRTSYNKLLIMHLERYLNFAICQNALPPTCSQLFNIRAQRIELT